MDFTLPFFKRLFAIVFLLHASGGFCAEPLNLSHLSFSKLNQLIPLRLSHDGVTSASPMLEDFLFISRHDDKQHTEHIRMQQRYRGFNVFGGYGVFHQRQRMGLKPLITMNGQIYQHLGQDLGPLPAAFGINAQQILENYYHSLPKEQIIHRVVEEIVYVDDANKAHWAFRIQVYLQPQQGLPSQPTAIIEANTGHLLLKWDALTTERQKVQGLGFGGNRRSGKYQFGKEFPYLSLFRDTNAGLCFLENEHIMVVDMQHKTLRPNYPMSFLCENENSAHQYWTGYAGDGYDQANGSYSVSNDAMYYGELVKKMYRSQYGVEVLRKGDQPMQMIFRVHYSNYFANAFWDGRQISFGDGDEMLHPLVALSITAHELSHGFTQQHSGLQYQGQAGGINEAFSDMAAQAAEYYVYGKATWYIGADVLKNKGALRWFDHPSRDGASIERAIDYQIGLDVHHSSGVYNYLYYLLATHKGWNPHKAFQVMVKANMDYWTPTTNFVQGACGILTATRDLGFSEDDVKDALDEVVIDYGDCED